MELTCYLKEGWEPLIRAASPRRDWMDATEGSYAYHCLPLTIANAHGWEILTPHPFEALWTGDAGANGVMIRLPASAKSARAPTSLFGSGILTFVVQGLFRTAPGWNLWVGGSPNRPKDGVYPLTGIVETDWSPFSFTINWRITRLNTWIRFEAEEPIGFVFPLQRGFLEKTEPKFVPMTADPELETRWDSWTAAREARLHERIEGDTPAAAIKRLEGHYLRGETMDGQKPAADHVTKLRLAEFTPPIARRATPAPAMEWPLFYRDPRPLDPARHGALSLKSETDFGFARGANVIPINMAEFPRAARDFPIVFVTDPTPLALAVVGMRTDENVFVGEDGRWMSGCYVPLYLRRYPFLLTPRGTEEGRSLYIDEGAESTLPGDSQPLFEDGVAAAIVHRAFELCMAFERDSARTQSFIARLIEFDLLAPSRAEVTIDGGRRLTLGGFSAVTKERLAALSADKLLILRREDALTAVYAHLISQQTWQGLGALITRRSGASP
ncbi:MAG: SapC family protein [Alphaproteobacteria bacterium]|nr:SapC family protein [Alphaproteobacteria bacterium]